MASYLLFKKPRGQTEKEKDFVSSYQGRLSPFENDIRKEKAGLKGNPEERFTPGELK